MARAQAKPEVLCEERRRASLGSHVCTRTLNPKLTYDDTTFIRVLVPERARYATS